MERVLLLIDVVGFRLKEIDTESSSFSFQYILVNQSLGEIYRRSKSWVENISGVTKNDNYVDSFSVIIHDDINAVKITGLPAEINLANYEVRFRFVQQGNDVLIYLDVFSRDVFDFFNIKQLGMMNYVESYFKYIAPEDKEILRKIYNNNVVIRNINRDRNIFNYFMVFIGLLCLIMVYLFNNIIYSSIIIFFYILFIMDQRKYFKSWENILKRVNEDEL